LCSSHTSKKASTMCIHSNTTPTRWSFAYDIVIDPGYIYI